MTTEIAVPLHKDSVINNSICRRQTRVSDSVLTFFIYLCASISILILIGIMGYVFFRGIPQINWEFLSTVPSTIRGTFGIL